eukprot:TRINITY_DN4849_c4_g1_i1.p1 TRINITY_DN4849_c4_g1~~TRINITY_DN4849_c4_g1_i1.p1  ORF type:complete len:243 (+),score=118.07 TRINITY_DN4849_c4_g1_i1:81-809(+)
MTMKLSAMQKRLKLKEKVPVSVAKPGSKRLRGHEGEADPLAMSAKPYKIAKTEAPEVKKGACGGAGVDVDAVPHSEDPLCIAAMNKLREQWLAKTLPRTRTGQWEEGAKLKVIREKIQSHYDLLQKAMGGKRPKVSGKKARYHRMGVKGQKWELCIWGAKDHDAVGLGYGTFVEALFLALDNAIATLMQRVAKKGGAAVEAPAQEDDDDEAEENEEMAEGEEGEEFEEEEEDDDDSTLAEEN